MDNKNIFPNNDKKFELVINKNTFFFTNSIFEDNWEAYISSITQSLLILKNDIQNKGLKKELFVDFITNQEMGIDSILCLIGLSKEMFLRLVTFIRIYNDNNLNNLVNKKYWPKEDFDKEWQIEKINNLIKKNKKIAEGFVNIIFKGSTIPVIRKVLPLFEYKKLDINKLSFDIDALIDTIVRYKTKGSYSGQRENNPEIIIEKIIKDLNIKYQKGFLNGISRSMDFIIPDKDNPKLIIESSYVITTSSGMGDKAKTEIAVSNEIKRKYPKSVFIGFVDGIGWFVRQGDLKRIVSAFKDVFTFDKDEIKRFIIFLKESLSSNCIKNERKKSKNK